MARVVVPPTSSLRSPSFVCSVAPPPVLSHLPHPPPGVILPCETQQVDFIFKSDTPGIKCELWQLTTHPVLLGGAAMQLTLRGVALDRDTNADHRLGLEVAY